MSSPRLFIDASFSPDARIALDPAQAHYVRNVMRLDAGGALRVFNDVQGEWDAEIVEVDKKGVAIATRRRRREPTAVADLILVFAPLKKTRTDFVVEKATELGVSALQPVFTRRTNAERVNLERLQALAREAAEQSERLDVPEVRAPVTLIDLLDAWPAAESGRRLAFCDEAEGGRDTPWAEGEGGPAKGQPALKAFFAAPETKPAPWAILIGPEGGFDPAERARLREAAFVTPVALGPRILRADTAAVAVLTLWQSVLGDWR